MERLTLRNSDGTVSQPMNFRWADALEVLAAYEDTGLEPKQVLKIANVFRQFGEEYNCWFDFVVDFFCKYIQAEQDGRLVVLPCNVGDTVWAKMEHYGPGVYEAKVVKIKAVRFSNSSLFFFADIEFNIRDPYYDDGRLMRCGASVVINDEFGSWNIAYLTREEAMATEKGGGEG